MIPRAKLITSSVVNDAPRVVAQTHWGADLREAPALGGCVELAGLERRNVGNVTAFG
jgi:hypothetical protein